MTAGFTHWGAVFAVYIVFWMTTSGIGQVTVGIDPSGVPLNPGSQAHGFTEYEKEQVRELSRLPPEKAVDCLGWLILNAKHESSRQFARQMFFKIEGWQAVIKQQLATAASAPTAAQRFGEDFDKRRISGALSKGELEALYPVHDRLIYSRLQVGEIFRLMVALKTEEAVSIVAPYLFHEAEEMRFSVPPHVRSLRADAANTLAQMQLPEAPEWRERDTEADYVKKWQRWWHIRVEQVRQASQAKAGTSSRSTLSITKEGLAGDPSVEALPATKDDRGKMGFYVLVVILSIVVVAGGGVGWWRKCRKRNELGGD